MNNIAKKITALMLSEGVSDVGFCNIDSTDDGLVHAVSLVVRLSDAVIDEITDKPTHTYFHHYRTVNAFLDRCALRLTLFFQSEGYRAFPIAASQSINGYNARFSHKTAACLSGLGTIGKSDLFLHKKYGPRVRLATVLTNCDFEVCNHTPSFLCGNCDLCARACPAMAIHGEAWDGVPDRSTLVDPHACSEYMKRNFQHIGRGAVCGVCMKVCPFASK